MRAHPMGDATLRSIKLVHTAAWALFAGAIILIAVAAALGAWRAAVFLIGLVLVECLVLFANRMRCPLTGVAARYTEDRTPNFDIYLPEWVAQYNKHIFGTLYIVGILFTLYMWRQR